MSISSDKVDKTEQQASQHPEEATRALGGFKWMLRKLSYRTGSMSELEEKEFKEDFFKRKRMMDCKRCEENKKWMLEYSPIVRFMVDHISKLGGNINEKTVVCEECTQFKAGGFHPELGIVLCQNFLPNQRKLEDTLAHELVHAYDHCKFDVDWFNLRHHACSEIRASTLSGECRIMNEFVRNGVFKLLSKDFDPKYLAFDKGLQACVKRRAAASVAAHPKCQDDVQAAKIVNEVFDSCFYDTRPFDDIYR
uniref:Mitochondrial inner membrane protease ATP23 n=1 Tax=Blastobotrys adeninivorans TaxID=409370 RepID=A0A060TCC2_BLAAD